MFDSLQQIYFERNRAFMVVFRYPKSWQTHHFEVNTVKKEIVFWDEYMNKGEELLRGNYATGNNELSIQDNKGNIIRFRKVGL